MSRFLTFATAVIVLAVVQAAVAALVIALTIMLLFYTVTRPRETLVFVGTLLVFGLASARPIACIVAIATIALVVITAAALQKSRCRPLLADQSKQLPPGGFC